MGLRTVLISIFISFSISLNAHEFYFSFAEMQYNEKTSQFEVSLEVTGHDFENYLEAKKILIPRLEDCVDQPMYLSLIEKELAEGFKLLVKDKPISLDLIGMKVNADDRVVFFLTSKTIDKLQRIDVRYDLLMDFFPLQQNKITVFKPSGKEFITFLNTRPKRTIEL